uniref:Solute carrier family 46 member 2 n=1 Tax=Erpetoichthys calabaricus TaxID=27687 RepID=A0A8C4S2C7_ERPCA
MCHRLRTFIEPAVLSAQFASTIYDTGLLMTLKERYNVTANYSLGNASHSGDEEEQKDISNFYMIYNILHASTSILTAFYLAILGDKGFRKLPVCCPLLGYVISRAMLLLVILLDWPVQVMFGAAALQGLSGGYASYWAGVMAIASDQSTVEQRSLQLVSVEVAYGVAGFIGSTTSGYIYNLDIHTEHQGAILSGLSMLFFLLSLTYTLFILNIHNPTIHSQTRDPQEEHKSINDSKEEESKHEFNILLLVMAALMYRVANGRFVDILPTFMVKKPLNWNAKQVGYGNAAGFVIFFTSFAGTWFFSKCLRDVSMGIIGLVSFASGLLVMAFVQKTYMFFIGKTVLFFCFENNEMYFVTLTLYKLTIAHTKPEIQFSKCAIT